MPPTNLLTESLPGYRYRAMTDEDARLSEFWEQRMAPTLRLPTVCSFTDKPEGFGTEVHFVDTPEGCFVLRLYPTDSHARLRGYLSANRVFTRIGALVPAILGTGRAEDLLWLVEKRVEGRTFRDLLGSTEDLARAAKALAEIHRNERSRYGEAGTWGGFRLTLRWRQRLPERWGKIVRLFPELGSVTEEVERWLYAWTDSFPSVRYQLLHGDYHPGNIALTQEDRVALLDLRTPRYGMGLLELVEALHHFTGEDPENWVPFLSGYLRERGEETRTQFEAHSVSLHAVFHLRHADRFAGLAVGHRGGREDRRCWERNAYDSWLRFCTLTGIASPDIEAIPESAFQPCG